jgi:hypothetical protein
VTAYEPSEWSDFFIAVAGASAALTGLVFVAVSINIERIMKLEGVPDRALSALLLLLGVVVVSLLALVPALSRAALGLLLLAEGLVWTAAVGVLVYRTVGELERKSWAVTRIALPAAGTLPFVAGGASVLAEAGGGLLWTFAGVVGAIVAGVMTAWVLLVEILR